MMHGHTYIKFVHCFKLRYLQISFDNEDHDGQMVLILDADPVHLVCKGDVEYFGEAGLLFQVYIVCFL